MPKFGTKQLTFLSDISAGRLVKMDDYVSRKWSSSGYASLTRAVELHNSGKCAENCPLPCDKKIVQQPLGPRGGLCYVLVDRSAE